MANPNTPQGNLNRLIASVVWNDFPELNVTASFLSTEGINWSVEGAATTFQATLTGQTTSLEPYLMVTLTLNLLRTQSLGDQYKVKMETNSLLGDGTIRPDTTTLSPFPIVNAAIESVTPMTFNGTQPGFSVVIRGYYPVNQSAWG